MESTTVMKMYRPVEITLRKITWEDDAIGQHTANFTDRNVMANRGSITRNEFFSSQQVGLRPEFMLTVYSGDYENEHLVVVDGEEYEIYRSYERPDNDRTELYLKKVAANE